MTDQPKCKDVVMDSGGWRSLPCRSRAVTAAGYCRTHDPDLKAARRAKRIPAKWQRKNMARDRLIAWLGARLSEREMRIFERAVLEAYVDCVNVEWPLPPSYPEREEKTP